MRVALRRVPQALVVMWGVATIVFVLMRVIGNPAQLMMPLDATPEQIQALQSELGLDRPLIEQYGDYMTGLVRGDFGRSAWMRVPVSQVLADRIPATLALAGVTILLAILIGVALGTVAAAKPHSILDRAATGLSFLSVSMPEFWFGLVLIAIVAVQLGWFPTSGYGTSAHFVLPVITLLTRPVGRLAQATKVALSEQLSKEHVTTALAKGLRRRRVLIVHGVRNSMLSVITLGADELAHLVAGQVVVETIFAWPGIGQLLIEAIRRRDPDIVVGVVVFVGAFVVVMNLVVDILYGLIDPRIRTR